jgi:hypothetical protein
MALGCTGTGVEDSATPDPCAELADVTSYAVEWEADPELSAGQESDVTLRVRDQRGCPIEDLQTAHERVVHTLLISADLSSFQHIHHEDFVALTADDLRTSTFHFPFTPPLAGDYRLVFDYAHRNEYQTSTDWASAGGAPAQEPDLALDYDTVSTHDGLTVELRWDIEPFAGFEAAWTAVVTDEAGQDVTDLVQWLGADAHAAVASADLEWVSHTHAWYPGMEDAAPGHPMAHLYDGPELPFHYTFPNAGPHKMWVQFTRAGAPDEPFVFEFAFDVAP